jgi:hypothetical protein
VSPADKDTGGLIRVLAYPFTGGAVALIIATLAGMVPYLGVLGSIAAGAFALPVVRTSGRGSPEADSMPRLLPPPPGLPEDLGRGAALFLVYLGPWFTLLTLALLSQDVEIPSWVYPFLIFPLFFQVVLLFFLPAAIATLALEGSPLPAFSRVRVAHTLGELGMAYGGLAAMTLVGGAPVYFLGEWLRGQGLVGRGLDALLAAWFWLLLLHLVGRAMRKRGLLEAPG